MFEEGIGIARLLEGSKAPTSPCARGHERPESLLNQFEREKKKRDPPTHNFGFLEATRSEVLVRRSRGGAVQANKECGKKLGVVSRRSIGIGNGQTHYPYQERNAREAGQMFHTKRPRGKTMTIRGEMAMSIF